HQGRRHAVRLLRARDDHDDRRFPAAQSRADPDTDHRGPERKHLPLLRLCEHPQSGPARHPVDQGGPMNTRPGELDLIEPERYELHEGPFYHFEISRREFVHVLGAGILISVAIPGVLAQRAGRGEGSSTLAQRLHLGADGMITVFTSKVEVGQGSRTQLTQAAAEELRVPVERVRLIMADSATGPDDGGTAGSRTTPSTVPTIRKACAAARQLLLDTAASQFSIDGKSLSVRDGKVEGLGPGKQFSYADLAGEKYAEALRREATPG